MHMVPRPWFFNNFAHVVVVSSKTEFKLDKDASRFMKNSTELTKKCMHICTTILFLSFEQDKKLKVMFL